MLFNKELHKINSSHLLIFTLLAQENFFEIAFKLMSQGLSDYAKDTGFYGYVLNCQLLISNSDFKQYENFT